MRLDERPEVRKELGNQLLLCLIGLAGMIISATITHYYNHPLAMLVWAVLTIVWIIVDFNREMKD